MHDVLAIMRPLNGLSNRTRLVQDGHIVERHFKIGDLVTVEIGHEDAIHEPQFAGRVGERAAADE